MLRPQFLKQLTPFYICSRHPFRGNFRGERRSLNRGTGLEFADYRVYEPGDDLRHVDWNIYARLGRLFIKLHHTDAALPLVLLIDSSRSMEFGTPTKLAAAKQLAAALGYVALAHADSVAVYTCAERLSVTCPPTSGRSQFARLTKAIATITADGHTRLTTCFKQLPMYQRHPGRLVILSDFLAPQGYAEGFKSLIGCGFSLTTIQLISPEEIDPQPHLENAAIGNDRLVEDAETGETKAIATHAETLAQYRSQQQTFCNNLRRFCLDRGIGYAQLKSDTDIETFILQELQKSGLIQKNR